MRINSRFLPLVKDFLGLKTPATPASVDSPALGGPVVQLRPGSRNTISISIPVIQICQQWQSMASTWHTASHSRTQASFLQHPDTMTDIIKEVKETVLDSTPSQQQEQGGPLPVMETSHILLERI
jgi:hypothetical protein